MKKPLGKEVYTQRRERSRREQKRLTREEKSTIAVAVGVF